MKVEFIPAAIEELVEAADRYERLLCGLGDDFVLETERLATLISECPSLGRKVDSIHRQVSFRGFPYALIFRCDREVIWVLAIAHHRRAPAYWSLRVQDRGADYRHHVDHDHQRYARSG